jgi:hypothetical protein
MASGEPAKRRAAFLSLLEGKSGLCAVVDYSYDTEKESWCQVTLRSDVHYVTIFMRKAIFEDADANFSLLVRNNSFVGKIIFEEAQSNSDNSALGLFITFK